MVRGCLVYTERAETATVLCGTSHASTVSTPLRWVFKKKKKGAINGYSLVQNHMGAQSLPESGALYKSDQQRQYYYMYICIQDGWWWWLGVSVLQCMTLVWPCSNVCAHTCTCTNNNNVKWQCTIFIEANKDIYTSVLALEKVQNLMYCSFV